MIKRYRCTLLGAMACLLSVLHAHADNPTLVGEHVSVGQKVADLVGPGPLGEEFYYASYIYELTSGTFDLVSVNPLTGAMQVYPGPSEVGARGMVVGRDGKIYIGTCWHAKIMEFDPHTGTYTDHGTPGGSYAETFISEIALGSDGNIYGGTYPNAKLIRYNTATKFVEDLGKVGEENDQYVRGITASTNGYVFGGTGSVDAKIVAYQIATGEKRVLLQSNKPGFAKVYRARGADENVYAKFEDGRMYRLNGFDPPAPVTGFSTLAKNELSDGSRVNMPTGGFGDITVTQGTTTLRSFPFAYSGKARRIMTFTTLASGPTLYGSGILDFNLFSLQGTAFTNIGILGGGEAYRMIPNVDSSKVLIAAYSGRAPLMIYDPAEDLNPTSNPILAGGGSIDATWRPHAMVVASSGVVVAGGQPGYGKYGGPLIRWNLETNEVENSIPIANESPYSLVRFGEKIIGGTIIDNGTGTTPIETQATLFIWNPGTRQVEFQTKMPGAFVGCLIEKGGLIYGFSHSRLFRFNPDTRELNIGDYTGVWPVGQSVAVMPDGDIWGLAFSGIFKVDTHNNLVSIVDASIKPTSGFAAKGTDLYFGDVSKVYKYTIPFSGEFDPTPPTVTLTTPTDSTTFSLPETVSIKATALDNVGVTKIWFIRDGVVVSTDTAVPYEYKWPVADRDNGTYSWTVKAFDAAGNSAMTSPVLMTVHMDNEEPTPPNGLIPAGLVRAMDLAWTASSDSGGSGMKGYRLDVSTESTFGSFLPGWENQFLGLVVSTRLAGLEADTVYYARLRAQDNRGNLSADSATVSSRTSVLKAEIPLTDGWLWSRGTLSKAGDTWTYAESTENGGHYVYKRTTSGISTSDYAQFSVLVKATASPARDVEIMLYNTDVSSNRATARCTLSGEGAVSTVIGGESTGVTGSISAKGEGWYLCNVLAKLDSRNGSNLTFLIWGKSGGNTSYVGDPAAGFQFKNPLITILPADTTPPTIPTLSAVGGSHSLGLSWTTSTDTGGSGLARYRVDVALDAGFTTFVAGWQNRDVGVLTSATVTGLGDYTNYSIRVRAEDNASNPSGFSNAVTTRTLDTLAPTISLSTPTARTTYTTPQSVLVKATATDAVGVTKVWFILNDVVVSTDTVSPYQYSWPITGANNGAHTWKAMAFDAMGNSSTTVAVPVTVNIDVLPPSTPVLQSPTEVSATSVRLNWSAATDNVRVIGYRLYRDTSLIATIGGEETSFLDSGLAPETLYKYTVAAFDDMGNTSAMSPELSVTTPRRALLAPRGSVSGVSPQSVGIRWTSVEGANRYTLAASLSVTSGHEFSLQREIPASETSDNESISGLSPNTTYYLYLNACNEFDCTDFVLLGSAVTHALAPALTAAEGKGKEVRLTINANGNPAGTKYRIEMRRGGEEFTLATTVTSLSPVMGDLTPGERYTFRVKAENHAGVATEPSNTLNVTMAPETMDRARAYPSPFRPGLGAAGITFDQLPEDSPIQIFTIDGRRIKTLTTASDGSALWDITNDDGAAVASGTYIAIIQKYGATKKLKVIVQK